MSDIAIYQASVPDRMRYAEALSQASLLPDSYRGKPANVLLALEYGAALGIPPMVAIQQVHVIQGRPVASAQLIGALVRKAGHRLRVTGDDHKAVCEIVRGDDPDFTFRSEWTIERAQAAKLTSKDTWRQYPANMLRARAITECARDACPEALAGVSYTAEELGDDTLPAEAYPETSGGVESATPLSGVGAPDPAVTGEGQGQGFPAAPSSPDTDIVDAVVVDETPAASEGSGNPSGAATSEGKPSAAPDAERDDARKAMWAALRQAYGTDDALARAAISDALGRDVESTKDLTTEELRKVRAWVNRGLPRRVAGA